MLELCPVCVLVFVRCVKRSAPKQPQKVRQRMVYSYWAGMLGADTRPSNLIFICWTMGTRAERVLDSIRHRGAVGERCAVELCAEGELRVGNSDISQGSTSQAALRAPLSSATHPPDLLSAHCQAHPCISSCAVGITIYATGGMPPCACCAHEYPTRRNVGRVQAWIVSIHEWVSRKETLS